MNKTKSLIVSVLAVLVFTTLAQAESDCAWRQVLDRKGVVAFARNVPGSRVLEIRAAGVINAPAQVLSEVLRDVPAATQWITNCTKGELLEQVGRNNMTMRYTIGLPWPLNDRDLVARADVEYDLEHARGISKVTVLTGSEYPTQEGMVRVKDMDAEYIFEYLGPEKTGIIMTTRVDPAGKLPAFLINFFSKYFAYKQFVELRKMCTYPKYKEAAKDSEDAKLISGIMKDKEQVRKIYANRLAEFSNNPEFVSLIVNDEETFDEFYKKGGDSGPVGEVLLKGWGSRESKKQAVRELFSFYLEKQTQDKGKIKELGKDDALIECLLTGQGKDCTKIQEKIAARLGCGTS